MPLAPAYTAPAAWPIGVTTAPVPVAASTPLLTAPSGTSGTVLAIPSDIFAVTVSIGFDTDFPSVLNPFPLADKPEAAALPANLVAVPAPKLTNSEGSATMPSAAAAFLFTLYSSGSICSSPISNFIEVWAKSLALSHCS